MPLAAVLSNLTIVLKRWVYNHCVLKLRGGGVDGGGGRDGAWKIDEQTKIIGLIT